MRIYVEYEDTENKYEVPLSLVAKEIGISVEQLEKAVLRVAEKT